MHTITGCPVKTHPKSSLMGGMWVRIKISKSWTMQSELSIIGKGTAGENKDKSNYGDYFYVYLTLKFQFSFSITRKRLTLNLVRQ